MVNLVASGLLRNSRMSRRAGVGAGTISQKSASIVMAQSKCSSEWTLGLLRNSAMSRRAGDGAGTSHQKSASYSQYTK